MKRLLAVLFVAALPGGPAQAQTVTVGVTLDFSYFASCLGFGPGSCSAPNGGCSRCRVCLPPPGWSPEYPKPMMYGGMAASSPYQGGYYAPYGGYGYGPAPMGYGYGWMPPAAPATPKISTVPPPEPAKGTPK